MPKFIFTVLFCSVTAMAQLPEKDYYSVKYDHFIGRDTYGNYYFSDKNNLVKTNQNSAINFQSTALGRIDKVIIQNPLLLVVFYKDFNTILLLDLQLNETKRINGNATGLIFEAAGLARQNCLWFFDAVSRRFGLYNLTDDTYKLISNPITEKIMNYTGSYNYFFWVDEQNEWHKLSFFGLQTRLGKIPSYDKLQLIDDKSFCYLKDGILYYVSPKEHKKITETSPTADFYAENGRVFIFSEKRLMDFLN